MQREAVRDMSDHAQHEIVARFKRRLFSGETAKNCQNGPPDEKPTPQSPFCHGGKKALLKMLTSGWMFVDCDRADLCACSKP
ncbi:hypothetical protein GCM10011452_37820 [Gemmobacter lanyuensis]|uniref:Uncharacterized protein n=1 Tax=Gemmobacter lanyuensis TaxID=1054497 RepID=A0A918J3L8_9RHOB|nr:hypothetical protein GCM10011452_37820 [Gemmobacter lanyuensis]